MFQVNHLQYRQLQCATKLARGIALGLGLVVALLALCLPFTASAASAWSYPFALGNGNKFPTVGIDSNGKIHFAWWNNTNNTIQYRQCDPFPGACLLPESISAPGAASYYPSLAVDSLNTVHVVWEAKDSGSKYVVYYRQKKNGAWGSIVRVSKNSEPYAEVPDIGVASNGAIKVVFQSKQNGSVFVYYAESADGSSFSASQVLTKVATTGEPSPSADLLEGNAPEGQQLASGLYPRIALDSGGLAYVVWNTPGSNTPTPYRIYYTHQGKKGWVKPILVASGHKDQIPDIAVLNDGRVGIAWTRGDTFDSSFVLFAKDKKAKQYDGIGKKLTWSMWTRLSVDCAGNVHLVFQGSVNPSPGYNWNVYHRTFNGRWSPMDKIAQDWTHEQVPVIATTNVGAIIYSDGTNVLASVANLGITCSNS